MRAPDTDGEGARERVAHHRATIPVAVDEECSPLKAISSSVTSEGESAHGFAAGATRSSEDSTPDVCAECARALRTACGTVSLIGGRHATRHRRRGAELHASLGESRRGGVARGLPGPY